MFDVHGGYDLELFNAVENRFKGLSLEYGAPVPPPNAPKAPRNMLQGGSPFVTSFGRPVLTAKSRKRKSCTSTYSNYLSIVVSARSNTEANLPQLEFSTRHPKNILQQL